MAYGKSQPFVFTASSSGPFSVPMSGFASTPKFLGLVGPMNGMFSWPTAQPVSALPFQATLKGPEGGLVTIRLDAASSLQMSGTVLSNSLGVSESVTVSFISSN